MFKKLIVLLIMPTLLITSYAKELIPGGESIGVIMNYEGVYITGSYTFFDGQKEINLNPDIKEGDLIIACNHQSILSCDDLIENITQCAKENQEILVEIKRNNDIVEVPLHIYYDEQSNSYKTGLYITDHLSAIGTMTYYDPESQTYGAFGHPIEIDEKDLNITQSSVYESEIIDIEKNTNKTIGKKIGSIQKTKPIGDVKMIHSLGIYGSYSNIYKDNQETLETEKPQIGDAYIYTTLEDNTTNAYTIYIDKINKDTIEFHLTDIQLINQTNGIIPGMSGSPIIQNNYIVGCVTHVIMNDPLKGYGIFIEDMLEVAK